MSASEFTITVYNSSVGQEALADAIALYREVYAEPPYLEGDNDFASFADELHTRAVQENFRLVLARRGRRLVGFAMGHQLPVNTRWWSSTLDVIPEDVAREWPRRTFAVIELAVLRPARRSGIGYQLHSCLTAGLEEERLTLLVRPEATPALKAYQSWGYVCVGQVRPYVHSPIYMLMVASRTS